MGREKGGPDAATDTVRDFHAAVIADFKISEFARLELPAILAGAAASGVIAMPVPLPPDWLLKRLKEVRTYRDFTAECDNIKRKIDSALEVLQPTPPPAGGGDVVVPPPPPTPATQRLRQIIEVLKAAKEMADNLEPKLARDSLKEARDMMFDDIIRNAFRGIRAKTTWYDIVEELRDVIRYLDGL